VDTFTYTLTDADGDVSSATVTVTVNPVNDAPMLGNNTFTINDGATLGLTGGNLSATDVDDAAAGLVFNVAAITNGYFQRVSNPGVPVTSFTQAETLAGQIQFVHDGSGIAPSFTISVTDGAAGAGPFAANITFNGSAPPPGGGGGGGGSGTGGGGGGGSTTITPPVTPPSPSPAPAPTPGPTGQTFLRGGTSSPAGSGEGGEQAEPSGTPEPPPQVAAVLAQTFVAESQIPTVRFQSATVETQSVRTEPEVEPIRAEMQVLPSSKQEFAQDDEEKRRVEVIMGSVKITGLALSVGAVWWAARAAGIIASLLASAPAWRHLDPLPVLGRDEEGEEEEAQPPGADDEGAKEEHRARWVLEGR
jgi:hypothetical protein